MYSIDNASVRKSQEAFYWVRTCVLSSSSLVYLNLLLMSSSSATAWSLCSVTFASYEVQLVKGEI